MLVTGVGVQLKEIIQTVCIESHAEIFALEVMPGHVHTLEHQSSIPEIGQN
jgi:REP element-mobilizing transposase RayT